MSVNLLTEKGVSNRRAACLPGVSEGCVHYHRRRRTAGATDVITTNKGVEALHESLASDEIPATAILDRLLHHATTLNIRGEGFRLKEKRKAGLTIQPPGKSEEKGDDRATSGCLVSQLESVENRTSRTSEKGTSRIGVDTGRSSPTTMPACGRVLVSGPVACRPTRRGDVALNGLMHKSGPEYLPENLDATREQAANRELDYRGFLAEDLATDEWNGWPR